MTGTQNADSEYADPICTHGGECQVSRWRDKQRVDLADGVEWLANQPAASARMAYLDPPYGHGTFGRVTDEWLVSLCDEAWRATTDDGIVYFHCDPQLMWRLASLVDLPLRGVIAWKNGWVSGFKSQSRAFWPRQYQLVAGFAKPAWKLSPVARPASEFKATKQRPTPSASFVYSDWWETPHPVDQMSFSTEKVGWPTQKPKEMLTRLILGSTAPGDVVLDPTCGSGTTLVAAWENGRIGRGADNDPRACLLATHRLLHEKGADR